MKVSSWVVVAAVLSAGFAQASLAQSTSSNSQQDRMKACNQEAKTKAPSGDAHKQFMSECLSGHPASTTGNSQQEKMKACNAQAKTAAPTGDAHKQFMSNCLKGSTTAAGGTSGSGSQK
jgi:hypothetical protein